MMQADETLLEHHQHEGIVTLTLNRPDHYNALSRALLLQLLAALAQISARPEVRLVILAANGKAFCSGHDLVELHALSNPEAARALFALCSEVMKALVRLPQPVIARVQGVATAAGCQLVSSCDLAVASLEARFAVSGIKLGLFCGTPAVALSRSISRKAAMEMLLTGEFVSASRAMELGLINRAVAAEELDKTVQELATTICSHSAEALRIGKDLFYRQLECGLDAAYQMASSAMACNILQENTQISIEGFINRGRKK